MALLADEIIDSIMDDADVAFRDLSLFEILVANRTDGSWLHAGDEFFAGNHRNKFILFNIWMELCRIAISYNFFI